MTKAQTSDIADCLLVRFLLHVFAVNVLLLLLSSSLLLLLLLFVCLFVCFGSLVIDAFIDLFLLILGRALFCI